MNGVKIVILHKNFFPSLFPCTPYTILSIYCTCALIDVSSPTWYGRRKHVFILSQSGKPVYSRYGSEEKLVNLFGIMQALVSIIEDSKDELRYFPC